MPDALWTSVSALGVAALGTLGLGVFHPRVALFGPVVFAGPREVPAVALTFDDGPHPSFTPRIAALLADRGARATFFCVGQKVEEHPALARELVASGHELGNHTHRHGTGVDLFSTRRLTTDLRRCQEAIATVTGVSPVHYRPAVGVRNPIVHAAARALSLTVVTWSDSARDGVRPLTSARARAMGERARPGHILTLHDGTLSGRIALREDTVTHLPELIAGLQQAGLTLVTLSELLTPA